jgi:HD-GYP domain-containing protein (c-di-GMP phosphodiesterase class II)
LGLSEYDCTTLYVAALLRDIGQIAIPDSILGKANKLTDEEMSIVAEHPKLGHAIVQKAPHLSTMLPAILHHHEHFDGSGYPTSTTGDGIPLPARILAAADAYQAMVTPRPHRRQMTSKEACDELVSESGKQFDPDVVQSLLDILSTGHAKHIAA